MLSTSCPYNPILDEHSYMLLPCNEISQRALQRLIYDKTTHGISIMDSGPLTVGFMFENNTFTEYDVKTNEFFVAPAGQFYRCTLNVHATY